MASQEILLRSIFHLFFFNIFSLSSSTEFLYPTFEHLYEHVIENSSLPICTPLTCSSTENHQPNYSTIQITHEQLLKLSPYEKNKTPFLIASTGIFRGKRIRYRHQRYVDQFLGIYYGELPNSLKKPVKKRFNYSIENATNFSPYCMQSLIMTENFSYGSFAMKNQFHDNCLSLNIYRADLRHGEKFKAIMLFSHGGSNQIGGGSLFDGTILASEGDIIVITMNFRLNYHGFLSSGDDRLRGNYGLWDQLLAVEWVYENAHLFGGDRHRITLAGHSAGAGNVMLIPASHYCRGKIKRIISQSGNGLAPWSINRQPMKLIRRLSKEFNCQKNNESEMFQCIHRLLEKNRADFYRLHLDLRMADDNPYPVIDNDFLNDTIENILQSDFYQNIDFLTGVTLNEGLYFAEYHIGHIYTNLSAQVALLGRLTNKTRNKRSLSTHLTDLSPEDTLASDDDDDNDRIENINEPISTMNLDQKLPSEQPSNYDLANILEQFSKTDYIQLYINANFLHGFCYIDEVRRRYADPGKENATIRLKLYIDLVSDLMFNFHMVHCLNLRTKTSRGNSSNYAYIYSHLPTFTARSLFRDQFAILPNTIGHFAELDYVFGVPLANGFHRIHKNVNMLHYNYSDDEIKFSRQIIGYWSNFIKTGNPNEPQPMETIWKPYGKDAHNYIFFQLNQIRNEFNYFDSMYEFWLKSFEIERNASCNKVLVKIKTFFLPFLITIGIFILGISAALLCQYLIKKNSFQYSHPRTVLNQNDIST